MPCEICGEILTQERKIELDGLVFLVCEKCVHHGRELIERPQTNKKQFKAFDLSKQVKHEMQSDKTELIQDYGKQIKTAREKKGLTIEDLAKKVFEKKSFLHRIESQNAVPSDELIKKLEKELNISLTTTVNEVELNEFESQKGMTLADLIDKKISEQKKN